MTNFPKQALLAVLVALAAAGCSKSDGDSGFALTSKSTPTDRLRPRTFESCTAYRRYYTDSLTREVLEGWNRCWGCEFDVAGGAPSATTDFQTGGPEAAPVADGGSAGFSDVSRTNTQEIGVDEADLIETDLRGYFYVARGNEVLVIQSTPAEAMSVVARVPLAASGYYSWTHGLYFDETNQRLVALMYSGPDYPSEGSYPARGGTGALFIDVSNPLEPQLVDWVWTEGWLVDSRRVDDRLHLVSSHHFYMPQALSQDSDFWQLVSDYYNARNDKRTLEAEQKAAQIRVRIDRGVQAAELSELLPLQKSGLTPSAAEPIDCAAVMHTDIEHRMAMLVITSVDTTSVDGDESDAARLATINNAWQLYASNDYLYLIQGSGGWWFDVRQRQQTAIYRFRMTDGAVEPAGFGVVDGYALNSYSFGEHDGFLRAVTTEGRFRPDADAWRTSNHLFVLGEGSDGKLETVGEVRDFILDERVFSARFLGDRGYVVTFQQIDPLFVFDLADPENPQLTGEVEIPGFSTYIHPLGDDHLLTIGRDGTFEGTNNNIRLQIFDVSDPLDPIPAHFYVPDVGEDDWVFSLAGHDPHAFTYYAAEQLLSIPLQVGSPNYEDSFSGFLALNVDTATGFTPLARIDHKKDSGGSGCPDTATGEDTARCQSFAPVYYNPPLRSAVGVEGERTVLFTLSHDLLKSADISALETELDSLELTPN